MAENVAVRDAELERQHVGVRQHGENNAGKQQTGWDNFCPQA